MADLNTYVEVGGKVNDVGTDDMVVVDRLFIGISSPIPQLMFSKKVAVLLFVAFKPGGAEERHRQG